MSEPLVSVVVATHDRPARLERLLDALSEQTLATFEVIVAAAGSPPSTEAVLNEELARGRLALRVISLPVALGPGVSRNAGWRSARAPLVAFTDDDCVPDSRWLAAARDAHLAHPTAIVQGRTEPDPHEAPDAGLLSRSVRIDALGPQYETCNILYPRELLEELGGFDEDFGPGPGGEDTDLAWRALDQGRTAVFASNAVVFHAVHRLGLLDQLRFARRWTDTMRIYAEHPGTRTMLHRRIFWNVWHYLLLRSAVAMLLPAWLRRPLLTMHLLTLAQRARRERAGAWAVPFLLVHDAVEMFAVIRGAIRYRTLVL